MDNFDDMKEKDIGKTGLDEFYRELDDLFDEREILPMLEAKVDHLSRMEKMARIRPRRFAWRVAGVAAACLLIISATLGYAYWEFGNGNYIDNFPDSGEEHSPANLMSMAASYDGAKPEMEAVHAPALPEKSSERVVIIERPRKRYVKSSEDAEKCLRMLKEINTNISRDIVTRISSGDFDLLPPSEEFCRSFNEVNYPEGQILVDATSILDKAIKNIRHI